MKRLTIKSPAKINLFLKVIGKRNDGYHNIITLFERINLCDEITLSETDDNQIHLSCHYPGVPEDEENLAYKAALLLKEKIGIRQGVKINIKKNIPVAAGLGGGSSNAAFVLLGLNKLWGLNLSRRSLLSYARKIGSDVPFFIYDCCYAIGTKRGDSIRSLDIRTRLWHVLVVPKSEIRASEVYHKLSKKNGTLDTMNILTNPSYNVSILIRYLKSNDILNLSHVLKNDLEETVLKIKPSLSNLKKQLVSLKATAAMVSGSGPAVFGITTTRQKAFYIKEILAKRFSRVFIVTTY